MARTALNLRALIFSGFVSLACRVNSPRTVLLSLTALGDCTMRGRRRVRSGQTSFACGTGLPGDVLDEFEAVSVERAGGLALQRHRDWAGATMGRNCWDAREPGGPLPTGAGRARARHMTSEDVRREGLPVLRNRVRGLGGRHQEPLCYEEPLHLQECCVTKGRGGGETE